MIRSMRRMPGCLVVLSLTAGLAYADVGPKWSDEELARFSEAIVTGRVVSVQSAWDPDVNTIYTYITLDVDEVLKGDIRERQVVFKQIGGQIDDIGLRIGGQATFTPGEEALVFLEVRPRDATVYTTALGQGKWNVTNDGPSGQRLATRSVRDRDRGIFGTARDERPFSTFRDRLTALAAADRRQANPRVLNLRSREAPFPLKANVARATAAFTFLGPARWHQIDSRVPVALDNQSGGQPGLAGGGDAEVASARALWNAAGSNFLFAAGVTRGARCEGTFEGDGRVSLTYMDPCGEIDNSGGTLGIGGGYFRRSDSRTVSGQVFAGFSQGYVIFNDSSAALRYLTNSGCFQAIATHEIAHSFGLGHSDDPGSITYPFIDNACFTSRRVLGADDIAGIRFIYGTSSTTTTAPGPPSGLTASASGSSATLFWNAPITGGTPTSYIIEAGSSGGATNLANFSTGSTATNYSAISVPGGVYFVRVKATNAAGTSAASSETVLVVGGGCTSAPTAPTGLRIVSNSGGTVVLSWNAVAGVTSYIVEAGSAPGGTNLANADLGSTDTSLTATSVGRGTYYVRIRGKNTCGTGSASNEIVVVVP